jgi:hypothetical protein
MKSVHDRRFWPLLGSNPRLASDAQKLLGEILAWLQAQHNPVK